MADPKEFTAPAASKDLEEVPAASKDLEELACAPHLGFLRQFHCHHGHHISSMVSESMRSVTF